MDCELVRRDSVACASHVQFEQERALRIPGALIHERFEEQVARSPEAIAVTCNGRNLTYAELNRRANRLANYLETKGVGHPDQVVGVCVERSVVTIVCLLGVLKAGGAYVVLDPADPADRLAYVMREVGSGVLLTEQSVRHQVSTSDSNVIVLDSVWEEIEKHSSDNLDAQRLHQRSHHLAYVTYTSGSTGRPKGVMTEHRNVTRFFAAAEKRFDFNELDVSSVFHSFAFDFSVWELFGALLYGGRAVVVPYFTARSPRQLYQLLCRERVTVLSQTPSAFVRLIDAQGEAEEMTHSLRLVIFAGESLKPSTLRSWVERNPLGRTSLVNMYGTTESTVHVTHHIVTKEQIESELGNSVGKPLPGLQLEVLDRNYERVPPGAVGEIYIGGPGVARGYFNRPELTAERFIADPFSGNALLRIYKTGDLGKWQSDGTIEYLGRNDHQVKIRGYRVELGEIENQLTWHDRVKEATVVAREDESGETRLVAYVSADPSDAEFQGSPEKLRNTIVGDWEAIFTSTYKANNPTIGPSFAGWNSSYRDQSIPESEMQEWLACTVERIKALQPSKILEIGCGVGLIVEQLAPQCDVYVGTDISSAGLEQLRKWLNQREKFNHVELLHRSAGQLQDLKDSSFDTVVLNSVVQYFPDIEYLFVVLKEAVRLTSPGGNIFLGDIRHLGLLPVLHSSVQLGRANATLSVGQLKRRVSRSVAQETELAIDPQLFLLLPGNIPGISNVTLQLKRGRAHNELTRYRYDVILQVGEHIGAQPIRAPLNWQTDVRSLAELEAILRARRWPAVSLTSIPNARLIRDVAAWRALETSDDHQDVGALRYQMDELQLESADPEILWELGEAYGYDVSATWGANETPEYFELRLMDRSQAARVPRMTATVDAAKPWSTYSTNPLQDGLREYLIPQLRAYLRERLPSYMTPSAWVVMRQLPLTPTGKVNRHALPEPDLQALDDGAYEAPRGIVEETLAEIWEEVLQVGLIGRMDNFFELGGHSFAVLKLVAGVAEKFDVPFEFLAVFTNSTLTQMANLIESLMSASPQQLASGGSASDEFVI